jgi:hypothetical protein
MSVRDGESAVTARIGDVVTSRWSSSGARWVVVGLYTDKYGRECATLASTRSHRGDTRRLLDMVIVERAS